ncbi:chromosome segregation protein SMC [Slackia heliotrinireducens]|nr:chromosome segregation protein SMC [Slackia heliotrinireducens]
MRSIRSQRLATDEMWTTSLYSVADAEAKRNTAFGTLQTKTAALNAAQESLRPLTLMESKTIKPIGFKRDLHAAKEAVAKAQQEYDAASAAYRIALDNLNMYCNQSENCQAEYHRLASDVKKLKEATNLLEAEIASLRTRLEEQDRYCKNRAAELQDAVSKASKLEKTIAKLQSEAELAKSRIKGPDSREWNELHKLYETRKKLEAQAATLHEQKRVISSTVHELAKKKEQLLEERNELEINLEALFSYCSTFSGVTEDGYGQYFEISKAIREKKSVYFGHFNSRQLKWNVLKVDHGRALLLGPIVGKRAFDESGKAKAWDECSLFRWLNESFFKNDFNEFEQEALTITGREFGVNVSIPDRKIVSETSFHTSKACWSAELVPHAETLEFRQYKQEYIRNHIGLKLRPYLEIANRIENMRKSRSSFQERDDERRKRELQLLIEAMRAHRQPIEDPSIPRILGSWEELRANPERYGLQPSSTGDNTSTHSPNENPELKEFDEMLSKLQSEAIESYEGDPYTGMLALKISGETLDRTGTALTGKENVRPIVWVPYFDKTNEADKYKQRRC